jgi:hypothetical protein
MNFVKLGEQYINLDTISSITPKNGLGYIAWIVGGSSMEISEEQMATIKTVLKQKDAINEINAFASRNPSKEEIFERLKKTTAKGKRFITNHKGADHEQLQRFHILRTA